MVVIRNRWREVMIAGSSGNPNSMWILTVVNPNSMALSLFFDNGKMVCVSAKHATFCKFSLHWRSLGYGGGRVWPPAHWKGRFDFVGVSQEGTEWKQPRCAHWMTLLDTPGREDWGCSSLSAMPGSHCRWPEKEQDLLGLWEPGGLDSDQFRMLSLWEGFLPPL